MSTPRLFCTRPRYNGNPAGSLELPWLPHVESRRIDGEPVKWHSLFMGEMQRTERVHFKQGGSIPAFQLHDVATELFRHAKGPEHYAAEVQAWIDTQAHLIR